ncbi:nickel ABC transporter substrate-binding protein [Helicobacter mesocricetorum]|uniref:nickel ABC transporter substrate-binding protein n=1 Tax=Helicobacter mesocricetorum TaxID=87012 RepID=UPI000CF0CA4B|nr:nickel ABC transporter substrate-binding protein [Helicobacter mesocricetorum]
MRVLFFIFLFFSYSFSIEITSAWSLNAGKINPHLYSPNQLYAQVMLYQGLVRYTEKGIEPQIAKSWEISNGGKTYTFKIQKDLKFSNGSPLDAYAIEANFVAILENRSRHSWLGLIHKIVGYKALSADVFRLELNSPYVATLNELALPRPFRMIAPEAMIDKSTKNGIKAPIGSGAFMLEESISGVRDVFVPNPHFVGKKPQISRLVMKILPDANARILAFESGSLDILVGKDAISRENFKRLSQNPKYQVITSKPQGTFHIAINASKDRVTSNQDLRRAIIAGVNKNLIWEKILLQIDPKADFLFNPSLPFCDVGLEKIAFNITEAKTLLKDKNFKPLEFVYVANNPTQKSIAEAIALDLSKIGLEVKLVASESTAFFQRQKNGNFDLIFNDTWGNPYDPHSFVASMLIPSHADFAIQRDLENKKDIDANIHRILNAYEEKTLQEEYRTLLFSLHKSDVYLPLAYDVVLGVYHKSKIKSYMLGNMENEFLFENVEIQ